MNGTYTVHEKYNNPGKNTNFDWDVAVIKLSKKLKLDGVKIAKATFVKPGKELADGTNCTASGWGATREYGPPSANLKSTFLAKVNYTKCLEDYKTYLTPRMVCAEAPISRFIRFSNICRGDSGGPLFVTSTKEVCGLSSFLYDCDEYMPAVFTNLADPGISEWIKNHTQSEN
ncbi:unnamed protein product [Leptidea sinapis]|uniref:Peptidase S1 domain-containing protein n=1 Tax=Leptidea sinapis TaxID=189913 RepID=A0A5E4QHH1_9NEOP|nr:unnamed protein product [Leptidea sinapis]